MTGHLLTMKDARAAFSVWHATYIAGRGFPRRGVSDPFWWHVFSFDLAPSIGGADARAAYDDAVAGGGEFLVLHGEKRSFVVERYRDVLPDFQGSDRVVFPPDASWTMCFTHEARLGPYFARAPAIP